MQLTQEQVDDWSCDANAMLSEENLGGTGVRASAEALLQSLVMCGSGGPAALANALQQRLAEAEDLQERQVPARRRHICYHIHFCHPTKNIPARKDKRLIAVTDCSLSLFGTA